MDLALLSRSISLPTLGWSDISLSGWKSTSEVSVEGLQLQRWIGAGGYADVYVAVTADARAYAIKLFRRSSYKDAHEISRLHAEMALGRGLAAHPNVVRLFASLVLPSHQPAILMELMEGDCRGSTEPSPRLIGYERRSDCGRMAL